MILPNPPVGVLCDINEAWKLNLELLEAGVRCHSSQESRFKKGYKLTSHVGLLWCYSKGIAPLLPGYAHFAVPMPEFRAAFGLNPQTTIMKKTIGEWLLLLPEPFKTQALLNANSNLLALSKDSLALALAGSFDWEDSPQGHKYWKRLYKIAEMHGGFHKWPELEQLRAVCSGMSKPLAKPEPEPVKLPEWWEQFKVGDLVDVIGIRVDAIDEESSAARLRVQDGTTPGKTWLYFGGANIRHHKAD